MRDTRSLVDEKLPEDPTRPGISVRFINHQESHIMAQQSGSVAVNHGGLWIPRQQFESAPDYFSFQILFRINVNSTLFTTS